MIVHCTDGQLVGETESTLFTILQQGPTDFLVVLKNSGVNTANYRFQEYTGAAWVDLGASGTDFYNTLIASQVRSFKVSSSYPQVRLVGNASGGAFLELSIQRYFNRASGGTVPLLNL